MACMYLYVCVCAAGVHGCMMERCGNECDLDQYQFVPDVTGRDWTSHFMISPLHRRRQAMTGEGTK